MSATGRSMLSCFALAAMLATSARADDTAAPFEWNVFLGPWQVLGPFDGADDVERSMATEFIGGEATARPDSAWISYDRRVLDFKAAFDPTRQHRNQVAYAWTTFRSERQQDATLAIGSDDSVIAWLNGEKVLEFVGIRGTYLDDSTATVRLRKGENHLLLKVANGPGPWGAVARLLPAAATEPLLSFEWSNPVPPLSFEHFQLPELTVEFLDDGGTPTARHRVSGFRAKDRAHPLYRLHLPPPARPPPQIKARIDAAGYERFEKVVSWEDATAAPVPIRPRGIATLTVTVTEEPTGKPIADARFVSAGDVVAATANANGQYQLSDLDPVTDTLSVFAAGYLPKVLRVRLPAASPLEVKLSPGGKILRGRITDEAGRPIRDAHVWIMAREPRPRDRTDADGRFVLSGIPENTDEVSPVVEHPEYAALMHFSERLADGATTEVRWKMQRGVIVTGRVTAKADGRPLAGVQIVTGDDRFPSNTALPQTTTDADGRYRLASVRGGGALVHAFSEDFAPAMQTVTAEAGEQVEIHFALEPGADVTGRVTDPSGKPLPRVWITTDTWSGARMFNRDTRTDADGRFRMRHMPATPVTVDILKRNYIAKRDLEVVGGQHYDIVLEPVVKHTVRVRLKDTGQPPPKLDIQRGYKWEGRDDVDWDADARSEGRWDAATGVFSVALDEAGNYQRLYRFRVPGYKDGIVTMPREAKGAQTFEVALEPSAKIRGRVVSAHTGEPLQGVTIAVVNAQDKVHANYIELADNWDALRRFSGPHTVSGADGSFELTAPEPGTDLLLIKRGAGFCYIGDAPSLIENGGMELPLPEPATLRGRVLSRGKPLPNEKLYIGWRPPASDEDEWQFPFRFGGQFSADEHGRFEVTGLGPGRYMLARVRRFEGPGGGGISSFVDNREVLLLPGQVLEMDFDRAAGHELKGRTLDERGQPLGECVVTLYRADERRAGNFEVVRSDRAGRFTIADVPAGMFGLRAEHYSARTERGRVCGLGDTDAAGSKMLTVAGPAEVEVRLRPVRRDRIARAGTQTSLVGAIPPDFTAAFFNTNGTFTLSEQLGKVVALDFWATWCGPCMAQLPEVKKLWEKYRNHSDVVFITISLDFDTNQLRRVIGRKEIDFPVIWSGDDPTNNIAAAFGVRGIPTSMVIGRNGRFATEPAHSGLAAAIETALAQPPDPMFAGGTRPARLEIELAFAEDGSGVPGAEVELTALQPDGSVARAEKLPVPGGANRLRWLYPRLEGGGSLRVVAGAPGLAKQSREIENPGDSAAVSFRFNSPRTIRGRLVAQTGELSLAGVKVHASRMDGSLRRSATTDEQGRFTIPAIAGAYYLAVEGNERVAAPTPPFAEPVTVEVAEDADPPEQQLAVSPAVTIRGRVVDSAGMPVAEAKVTTLGSRKPVSVDEQGRFELPGVPASSPVTIWAGTEQAHGRLELSAASTSEEYTIRLGERRGERVAGPAVGERWPELRVRRLAGGEEFVWRPPAEGDTLVVICAFWHPEGRRLLRQAIDQANRQRQHLAAFSIDWTPEQAARHLKSLAEATEVFYAGPADLLAGRLWKFDGFAQSCLVSSDGRLLKGPVTGKLP